MRAHAPGSVTTMFAPAGGSSHGVSFTTEDGVVADVSAARETTVTLNGEPTSFEPVELACEALDVDARVDLTAEVPVGCGFGASGAATLATALAADVEFDLDRDRDALVEVAADAEIEAGTGLGDVYVQNLGGLVWNVGAGRMCRDRTDPVAYATYGDIETSEILGDEAALDRVREAAEATFPRFDPAAPLPELFALSWEFAEATGLVTDRVREVVDEVADAGGTATMAMVGETVLATGTGDVLDDRTRITPDGAELLD